ncbi:MAG: hypothetical protein VYD87_15275, partial [Pseudomonadota bacterium]|nr:hypothetical protein [Pseudomonadota bacterium]
MTRPIRPLRPWLSRGRPVLAGSAIAMMAAFAAQAAPAAPAVGAPPAARAGAPAPLDAAPEARPIVLAAAQTTTAAAAPVNAASLEA